jgi:hypothetical protein
LIAKVIELYAFYHVFTSGPFFGPKLELGFFKPNQTTLDTKSNLTVLAQINKKQELKFKLEFIFQTQV